MTDLTSKGGGREPDLELFVKVRERKDMERKIGKKNPQKNSFRYGNVILFPYLCNAIVALVLQQSASMHGSPCRV